MLILALWLSSALAGTPDVTLNGVDIGAVRDRSFTNVDVYIDAEGKVHLTSDRYEVQVQEGADAGGVMPPPRPVASSATPTPRPSRLSGDSPRPSRIGGGVVSSAEPVRSSEPVAPGSWWLATEDNASRGHEVRVYLNGTLVKTISSGQAQVIEDVSRHLRRGPNDVMIMSRSLNPGGGGLYVYVGAGSNQGGSVTLSKPDIQHGLGASQKGDDVRKYTLLVP